MRNNSRLPGFFAACALTLTGVSMMVSASYDLGKQLRSLVMPQQKVPFLRMKQAGASLTCIGAGSRGVEITPKLALGWSVTPGVSVLVVDDAQGRHRIIFIGDKTTKIDGAAKIDITGTPEAADAKGYLRRRVAQCWRATHSRSV